MRVPYFIQGAVFGPIFIGLTFILKTTCPVSAGVGCFADYLAVPVFLPLTFIYKIVGNELVFIQEWWFLTLYWSLVGLLVGFIFDLRKRQYQY